MGHAGKLMQLTVSLGDYQLKDCGAFVWCWTLYERELVFGRLCLRRDSTSLKTNHAIRTCSITTSTGCAGCSLYIPISAWLPSILNWYGIWSPASCMVASDSKCMFSLEMKESFSVTSSLIFTAVEMSMKFSSRVSRVYLSGSSVWKTW